MRNFRETIFPFSLETLSISYFSNFCNISNFGNFRIC